MTETPPEEGIPSLVDINLEDAIEFTTVPDDSQQRCRVVKGSLDESKSVDGRYNIHFVMVIDDREDVDDIHYYLPVPEASMRDENPREYGKMVGRIAEAAKSLGFQTPVRPEDVEGNTGWFVVGEEMDDRTGKMRNFIRRPIVPRD